MKLITKLNKSKYRELICASIALVIVLPLILSLYFFGGKYANIVMNTYTAVALIFAGYFWYKAATVKLKEKPLPTIETEYSTVTYHDDRATRDALFEKMLAYYKEHETFSGESIMQMDGPLLAAPDLVSDIADEIFKFEVTHKD